MFIRKKTVADYLDRSIRSWRQARDSGRSDAAIAAHYVDAFQSARISLLGATLPEEPPEPPAVPPPDIDRTR